MADGDGRALLNLVEQIADHDRAARPRRPRRPRHPPRRALRQVRRGHYNLISALHKSVRGSDPDAGALLARPDARGRRGPALPRPPHHCAWRSRTSASPTPTRRPFCLAAWQSYERLGSPEGELALAEAVIYLALAPKSNAAYRAYWCGPRRRRRTGSLRRPSTSSMRPTR
jgi:putative ATPase